MITQEQFTEDFDSVEYKLSRAVRESNDAGWFPETDLMDENQLTTPPKSEKGKVAKEENGRHFDKDGDIWMYEHPSVPMSVTLGKIVDQGVNSMWGTAQKILRKEGTDYCIENADGQLVFKASDLTKGRARLSVADKAVKAVGEGATTSDLDAAIAKLQALKDAKAGN